eukprot:34296-Chlamydomonas_euryale.AAC.1
MCACAQKANARTCGRSSLAQNATHPLYLSACAGRESTGISQQYHRAATAGREGAAPHVASSPSCPPPHAPAHAHPLEHRSIHASVLLYVGPSMHPSVSLSI